MQKEKRVKRVGFEQNISLSLAAIFFRYMGTTQAAAELVGSNPTRSISFC
jgi:hypothetical protein